MRLLLLGKNKTLVGGLNNEFDFLLHYKMGRPRYKLAYSLQTLIIAYNSTLVGKCNEYNSKYLYVHIYRQ